MRYLVWTMAAALAVALSAAPAYAWHCPTLASEAKAVISRAESMGGNAALIKKAKDLEAQGEKYHSEGKHNEAMEHLAKSIKKAVYSVTGGHESKRSGHSSMEGMGSHGSMKGHKSDY